MLYSGHVIGARALDGRIGRVFSLRLTDDDERQLRELHAQATAHMPPTFGRKADGFGWFIVWAARQWRSPAQQLPPLLASPPPLLRRRPQSAPAAKRSRR